MSTKKSKVISYKNLPAKIPIVTFAVIYLFMDKFNAPSWLWGVIITLCVIITIAAIYAKVNQEEVDLLNDKK